MQDTFSQDSWYAIAASGSVSPEEVIPARLFDEERVVWRDDAGGSHVWDNRCIHRGMRLQYGFVDGGRLACRYHGWRFGPNARCVHIPAHPDMTPPDDFCIPAYASEECGGLIWASLGSPEAPPDVAVLDGLEFCRSVAVAVDAAAVVRHLPAVGYVGFGTAPGATFAYSAEANGIHLLTSSTQDKTETIAIVLQPVAPGRCQLHLLAGSAGDDLAGLRHHVSRWARRLRWFLENGAPEDMTWSAGKTAEENAA